MNRSTRYIFKLLQGASDTRCVGRSAGLLVCTSKKCQKNPLNSQNYKCSISVQCGEGGGGGGGVEGRGGDIEKVTSLS